MKTILLQGAMDKEIKVFLEYFDNLTEIEICDYKFYDCIYKGNRIIISKTEIGIINATISTTIAIERFKPDIVINQGSCGGHTLEMTKGSLIICDNAVYINSFYSNIKNKNEGSNSLEWGCSNRSYKVSSSEELVNLAESIPYNGNKLIGTIGSGDLFSREYDRIVYLNSIFGELGEDMETVASFKVCEKYNISRIAFRIVANNELLGDPINSKDSTLEESLQRFVIEYLDRLLI